MQLCGMKTWNEHGHNTVLRLLADIKCIKLEACLVVLTLEHDFSVCDFAERPQRVDDFGLWWYCFPLFFHHGLLLFHHDLFLVHHEKLEEVVGWTTLIVVQFLRLELLVA